MKRYLPMISVGTAVALVALYLTASGNPANMGFCIACFLRDTVGALGLHRAEAVQYFRPEIPGIILGSLALALSSKEFQVRGGSSPITRFILGMCVMIGALIFLGCPLRMILRIAGGDLNAVVGLGGFVVGIGIGIFFLNRGFSLKRAYPQTKAEGFAFPGFFTILLILLVTVPGIFLFSKSGPGASHAPLLISLLAGLLVGGIAQKTRLCFIAGVRDTVLFKDFPMLIAFITMIVVGLVGNMVLGNFQLGFANQPIAHTDGLWNFLGLLLVGFGSALLGGCPLRQLVLAGSGVSDAAVTVLGLMAGAAICHNFSLASSAAGVTLNGKIGFILALLVVLIIALVNTFSSGKKEAA